MKLRKIILLFTDIGKSCLGRENFRIYSIVALNDSLQHIQCMFCLFALNIQVNWLW